MDYRTILQEENDAVRERLDLSMERVTAMGEEDIRQPYGNYFRCVSRFILMIGELVKERQEGRKLFLTQLQERNHRLYEDILPEHYEESFANPDYAVKELGEGYGQILSALYTEIRGDIVYAFEMRLENIAILNEVFLEVYNLFVQAWEEGADCPKEQQIKDAFYWYVSDYSDLMLPWRIREGLDPKLSFAKDIIMESDLNDLSYLYEFGEYISQSELKLAAFMNTLPQETVDKMADTYTEGYRKGFSVMGRDITQKKTVVVEYQLGFERMIREAVKNFRKMGLEPIFYRAAVESLNRRPNGKRGYFGASANKQYDYDHRYDSALYMGNAFKERKLSILKAAYEQYSELASWCAGPAVVETFGEEGFTPVNKKTALGLNDHQQELTLAYANESRQVINQYMPGDETSFTIIAFPVPAIGEDFQEIFSETIRINTLDYEWYKDVQQKLIDVLDQAEYVTVSGRGANETNLKISLHLLTEPQKQTNFENCVADVNIPVGEVFTSPILAGTEGLLHVENVYIGEFQFKNLRMRFEEGKITEYSCDNFENPQEGKDLIRQQIMKNHDTLAMGEFAIGTNTAAYAMARRFGIVEKLPILIAEKMGPHFAVGDTCYSWSEDSAVYNPDGKEIIARDNEVSLMRKEDPSKAYYGCHTDITIPYSELGDITAVCRDGKTLAVIRNGKFAVEGTEALNKELGE